MKYIKLAALACAILFAFHHALLAAPDNEFNSGYKNGGLCFYEHANFKGRKFCARTGEKLKSLSGIWNNNFSSVQLDQNLVVYVCQSKGFSGRCRFFRNSTTDLGGDWNDQISSVHIVLKSSEDRIARLHEQNQVAVNDRDNKEQPITSNNKEESSGHQIQITPGRESENSTGSVRSREEDEREDSIEQDRGRDQINGENNNNNLTSSNSETPAVCFYSRTAFRGEEFCIESNKVINRLSGPWNKNISSVKIMGRAEITLCEDGYLDGDCLIVNRTKEFFSRGWSNRISSVRIRYLNTAQPETFQQEASRERIEDDVEEESKNDDDEETEVCFYQKNRFRGRKACVLAGQTVNRLNRRMDKTISSFEVRGDAKVFIKVCDRTHLEGECQTFYGSKRFIGWTWNDRISSMRIRLDRRGTY